MSCIVNDQKLLQFTNNVFQSFSVSEADAQSCADNFVTADMRSIPSHGVARLQRYVDGMKDGVILPLAGPEVVLDSASNATEYGHAGLGQVVGSFSTKPAIEKAKKSESRHRRRAQQQPLRHCRLLFADDFIDRLKNLQKADGQNRVFIHGEKEYEKYEQYKKEGMPLQDKVCASLKAIGEERGISFKL